MKYLQKMKEFFFLLRYKNSEIHVEIVQNKDNAWITHVVGY